MSKKSFIDSVRVEDPCSEDWDSMTGNDRVRFCSHCSKNVTNLSTFTRKEAMRLVRANSDLCIQYLQDPGTRQPLFADRFFQITRRAPGLAAGVMSASLGLSTMAFAQAALPASPADDEPVAEAAQYTEAEKDVEAEETPEPADPSLASVEGLIWDHNGKPVAGVQLLLVKGDSDHDVAYRSTNQNGYYRFDELVSGTYILRVESAQGIAKKVTPGISISEGQTVVQNLHVTVTPPASDSGTGVEYGMGGAMATIPYSLALSQAVADNDTDAVQQLIATGSDVNGRDENYDDITPLFLAVENGNVDLVRLLLGSGAGANLADKSGRTPLMFIDRDATAELIDILIAAGASVDTRDNAGNTPLLSTIGSIADEVLKALVYAGADINWSNDDGVTPLIKAADDDDLKLVKLLVLAGADINARNKNGESAWDKTSDTEIEDYLASHGAAMEYGNVVVAAAEVNQTPD